MKDKVTVNLDTPSITLSFKINEDNDTNFDFMNLLIENI